MGILASIAAANQTPAAASQTTQTTSSERKSSEVWLNVGITIPGAGDNGTDLFVSLPVGLPLDDMKAIKVTGSNQNSIHLKQVKNMLLDELQKLGAGMQPGQRQAVPQLSVEVYRVAKPEQTGTAEGNPLIAGLFGALKKS
jgi:hypothetical protein